MLWWGLCEYGFSLSVQQSLFSCLSTTGSQTVVFLAQFSYTALPGVDMPSLLTSPYIVVTSTQLQVDTTCPVVMDSLKPESCPAASPAPPTDPPTNVTVVAVCVIITLVVTIIVAIVTAVILLCRKQQKYKYVCSIAHHTTFIHDCQ